MTQSFQGKANRREFLTGAGLIAAASAAPAAPAGSLLEAANGATVVLHDPRIAMSADVAERLRANGARIISLDGDAVRLWRDEVGSVLRDPQTRLFGLTRWADYVIVRGLAAETRRFVRYEQLHAQAGHFTWLIA